MEPKSIHESPICALHAVDRYLFRTFIFFFSSSMNNSSMIIIILCIVKRCAFIQPLNYRKATECRMVSAKCNGTDVMNSDWIICIFLDKDLLKYKYILPNSEFRMVLKNVVRRYTVYALDAMGLNF